MDELIENLDPELLPGQFVFIDGNRLNARDLEDLEVLASVMEPEGPSLIVRQSDADHLGLEYDFVASWILLGADSALDAVGLTAEVSSRLADAGIACNVVAGLRHDHLLVPSEEAETALRVLQKASPGRHVSRRDP